MNPTQKNQIRQMMFDWMKSKGIVSNAKLAKAIGISDPIITYINSDQYEKISDQMWQKIGMWAGYFDQRQAAPTVNFKRIVNICRHTQSKGLSRAISFNPGTGKTFSLQYYKNNHENVFYVQCDGWMTKRDFLRSILKEMGLAWQGQMGIGELCETIIEHLNSLTKPLLIIDEADEIRDKLPTFLKTFYNKSHTGIVIAGGNGLKKLWDRGVKILSNHFKRRIAALVGSL